LLGFLLVRRHQQLGGISACSPVACIEVKMRAAGTPPILAHLLVHRSGCTGLAMEAQA
jgi:hypothetical protein